MSLQPKKLTETNIEFEIRRKAYYESNRKWRETHKKQNALILKK